MIEKTISEKLLYQGKFLKFVEHKILIETESPIESTRQFVLHPGGVCVVPVLQDKIILVKQYRKPVEKILLEVPAGKKDSNEDPLTTAKRELEEETGFTARQWNKLGETIPCPGYSDEILHIYLARDLEKGILNPDADEIIETEAIGIDDLLQRIYNAEIQDSKTVVALTLALKYLRSP